MSRLPIFGRVFAAWQQSSEVEFGLNVSGEGSLCVAKVGAEANLSIKVTWDFGS
jgi:inner membrane protein involved in colicin E2 resistance